MTRTPVAVRRDGLGWIALAMLAAPAILAVGWGIYRITVASGGTTKLVRAGDGLLKPDSIPAREKFELLFLVLWTSGLNVLLGGLITGWVWIHRVHSAPWARALLLTAIAIVIGAVPIWAWSQVSSPRAEGVLMLAGSAVAMLAAYLILDPRQSAQPNR
jgi:hypothetical protein